MATHLTIDPARLVPPLAVEEVLAETPLFDARDYIEDYKKRFPRAFEAFTWGRIYPPGKQSFRNPFTGEDVNEDFSNITYHCVSVAVGAERIARLLFRAGKISDEELNTVIDHALIHDCAKVYELFKIKAYRAGHPRGAVFLPAAELEEILRAEQVPENIIPYMVSAGAESGGSSLHTFLATDGEGITGLVQGRLVDKIVRLADSMTYSSPYEADGAVHSGFMTHWERLATSGALSRYPQMVSCALGVTRDGAIEFIPDLLHAPNHLTVLGSFMLLEVFLANEIARELVDLLGVRTALPPEEYICQAIR